MTSTQGIPCRIDKRRQATRAIILSPTGDAGKNVELFDRLGRLLSAGQRPRGHECSFKSTSLLGPVRRGIEMKWNVMVEGNSVLWAADVVGVAPEAAAYAVAHLNASSKVLVEARRVCRLWVDDVVVTHADLMRRLDHVNQYNAEGVLREIEQNCERAVRLAEMVEVLRGWGVFDAKNQPRTSQFDYVVRFWYGLK